MAKKQVSNEHIKFAVLATDVALFTIKEDELYVRVINVNRPPHFVNVPGLPGGLLAPDETAEEAIERLLEDKALMTSPLHLEQLYTFTKIDRDPRGRVVAVAYLALVPWDNLSEKEKTNSNEVKWVRVADAKKLAYDHDEILDVAVKRLRSRISYTTVISRLLPREFTLTELKAAYEAILQTALDKRNFRKKFLKMDVLNPLEKERSGTPWRPAQLYEFKDRKVKEIEVL